MQSALIDGTKFGPITLLDQLNQDNERRLLHSLLERVTRRLAGEQEIESRYAEETASEQQQYDHVFQLLTENYDTEQRQLEQTLQSQLNAIEDWCRTETARTQGDYSRELLDSERRLDEEMTAAEKERDEAVWLVSSLLDDDSEGSPLFRLQQTETAIVSTAAELKTALESLDDGYDRTVAFLRKSHLWSDLEATTASISTLSLEELKQACDAATAAGEPLYRRILGRLLPRFFFGPLPIVLFAGITALIFGLIWGLFDPTLLPLKLKAGDRDWVFIAAAIASAIGLLSVFFLHLVASRQTFQDYDDLVQHRANAHAAFAAWEKASKSDLNMLEAECTHLHDLRVRRRESALAGAESKYRNRVTAAQRLFSEATTHNHSIFPARLNELESQRAQAMASTQQARQEELEALAFRRDSDFRQLQTAFDSRMAEVRQRYQQAWIELIRSWKTDLQQFGTQSDALCALAESICPNWTTILHEAAPLPQVSPPALSLGKIVADLDMIEGGISADPRLAVARQRFDLPALLPLHERPSLILKSPRNGRDEAITILQATMLRFLSSLPPGKVRFTILDPIGLGANFSAFMHLTDFDELLVSSRIWTEPTQIEKRLADLTEHMETVLQTYLRNEFATIDDYNEFAGEVAEPYRLLVIANFPSNFTDIALRRLISIAEGGRRCGVYLLMSFDTSQELPRGFSTSDLEKFATVLEWNEDGFRYSDPDFAVWPLALDAPPAPELFGRIVRLAGQHARDARRVEVPFERVAPDVNHFWASDSRKGIDVPIGRAGATKLQSLRLGKGTSQHVLIAGKTGSGKSTLLHALITNLALYYSPAEVEFYLIDFKKGVEFKVYAEQKLPHARVIAIESDREFGLSVLGQLDRLLRERGELFREAGVQDISAYRDARPKQVMPRTLLLVDEFQEFFVEDDATSQQASLLLDRLIRQGRAFGVHILLGSQTLAGAYSLARSTLGQIAVRIALQCSETDAHLILSEDNTAARLLSRPGEAIYNDANGLIEGNHPFQVVWLSDEERGRHLSVIYHEANGQGNQGRCTDEIKKLARIPPLVFEGNIPADPLANHPLQRVIDKGRQAIQIPDVEQRQSLDSPWTMWVGDAVSLSGSIELKFGLRDGGNVLIVGRDEKGALGVMAASAMALCAQSAASGVGRTTIHLLDGSLPNSESQQIWQQLAAVWNPVSLSANGQPAQPGGEEGPLMRIATPRETASVIIDVLTELRRRADEPGPPIFLFVYDLARFRDLRKSEDDFGFGSSSDKPTNSGQVFSEILKDGPAAGIFTITWCDSYQTSQRWLSRDQMNRFEQRVLFAMNANDSSSLVDSPLAGRLGENRALLYRGDVGTLEKFRPFSPPSIAWLTQITSKPDPQSSHPAQTAAVVSDPTLLQSSHGENRHPNSETEDPSELDPPHIDEMNIL